MNTNIQSSTRKLTESAIMLALAVVLSLFAVFKLPNGGSVTIGSMLPILLISFKYSTKWSMLVALTYSGIQMMLGFWAPPVPNFLSFTAVVLLDYVIAYGVLGLGGLIYRNLFEKLAVPVRMAIACVITFTGRFVCHYFSGLFIWGSSDDRPAWLFSLAYNSLYMICEAVITTVIIFLIGATIHKLFIGEKKDQLA